MYFCNISSPKNFSPRPQLHTPTVLSPYCLSFVQSDMGHQNFVECILVHMFHLIELHVKPCWFKIVVGVIVLSLSNSSS